MWFEHHGYLLGDELRLFSNSILLCMLVITTHERVSEMPSEGFSCMTMFADLRLVSYAYIHIGLVTQAFMIFVKTRVIIIMARI